MDHLSSFFFQAPSLFFCRTSPSKALAVKLRASQWLMTYEVEKLNETKKKAWTNWLVNFTPALWLFVGYWQLLLVVKIDATCCQVGQVQNHKTIFRQHIETTQKILCTTFEKITWFSLENSRAKRGLRVSSSIQTFNNPGLDFLWAKRAPTIGTWVTISMTIIVRAKRAKVGKYEFWYTFYIANLNLWAKRVPLVTF